MGQIYLTNYSTIQKQSGNNLKEMWSEHGVEISWNVKAKALDSSSQIYTLPLNYSITGAYVSLFIHFQMGQIDQVP